MTRRLRIIDFVAVGQIFTIAYLVFWNRDPVDGAIVIVIEEPRWDRRGNNCGRDTEDEAGIQVITLLVNIGVVLHENGRVEPKLGLNGSARFGLSDTVTGPKRQKTAKKLYWVAMKLTLRYNPLRACQDL